MTPKETILKILGNIGYENEALLAFREYCRNATLLGLADMAFYEWASADYHIEELASQLECSTETITLKVLQANYPLEEFKQNDDFGLLVKTGRLISLNEYHQLKDAINQLGDDEWTKDYIKKFGRRPALYSHLDPLQ